MITSAKSPNPPKGLILYFRSYFEMPYEPDEILAEFGYSLSKARFSLPKTNRRLEPLSDLRQRIEESLLLVNLSSEAARRETRVAPGLLEVAHHCQC